ncbi:hypothetical protein [Paraburkholderia sp. SIMBA_053]|uniref:hypothetical protein n=1 Tax=Paraburkholderia sp. SIMBA_053 TaxID=3085794 RepID=UPI00397AC238
MRWSKSVARAEAPPLDEWPKLDYSTLSKEDKEFIENRELAVRMLFQGAKYTDIRDVTGVSKQQTIQITKICLTRASDGRILGFRGLLPFTRTSRNTRRNEIKPKRRDEQGGMACALQDALARYPDLEKKLIAQVRKEKKEGLIPEFKIKGSHLHRLFLNELEKYDQTKSGWPFTAKYRGIKSVVRFMRDLLDRNLGDAVRARGGSDAKAHFATGSGISPILPFSDPFDAVEIDAHHIDALFTVVFKTPIGTEVESVLERLWLLAVVERVSTCVLAYRVVYRTEVTAVDVAGVIRDAICKRWVPKDLTLGTLKYPPGGGFPSGLIPEAEGALWTVTLLDGALVNLSNLIHDSFRKDTGSMVNWGAPAHFERRPNIERTFKQITDNVFLRLPSTTGSNPKSGRAADAADAAKRYRIRADDIDQLLDVAFAAHNGLPGQGNFYNSPLETLRQLISGPSPPVMVRKLPLSGSTRVRSLLRREVRKVRGGIESGRKPYIQYENALYTNPVLSMSGALVGKELTIYIDEEDLRSVRAYTSNGYELGVLSATRGWNLTKHSLATRQAIFQLVSRRILILSESEDPVQAYLRYLAQQVEKSRKAGKGSAKDATNLTRVAKDAGEGIPALASPDSAVSIQAVTPGGPRLRLVPLSGKRYKVTNR